MIRLADLFPDTPAGATPLRAFDWAAAGVALPYVIFITGRCGSTLLTHLLAASGLCGNPDEFFNEERIVELAREWGTTEFPAYFRAVVQHSASNSRFGFEIDPLRFQQLRELIAFPEVFPPQSSVYFWMTRRDIVSQGWSYAKAKQTGLWQRFADGSEKRLHSPTGGAIDDMAWWREIILTLSAERMMAEYFAAAQITPFRLDYEMLVTDRRRTVIGVLQALWCRPDEIALPLGSEADHTVRNNHDDRDRAMIEFYERYRNELRYVEYHRDNVNIDWLRQELSTRFSLAV